MELYSLVDLLETYRQMRTPTPPFWLQFFPGAYYSDKPKIQWDEVYGDDRYLAPFVLPTMQGRPQKLSGYESKAFAPAYIKMNDPVTPDMFMQRVAGEALGGTLSLEQRRQAVIAELIRMGKQKIENRKEWMAARAIIDGEVTIEGEDYPTATVDFRRDASLDVILAGGAQWTQNTSDPLANIQGAKGSANRLSGARIKRVIFGQDAWDMFAARVDLKEQMNTQVRGGFGTNVSFMSDGYDGQEFMGVIQGSNGGGRIEAWVDTSKYKNDDGSESFFLPQTDVVGVADPVTVRGLQCFGAIMDKRAGYRPLEVFIKNYDVENPSAEHILIQSAPIMVPRVPNATFRLRVAPTP